MRGDDRLRRPGETLDDRDETDPEWTVDHELSAQCVDGRTR